MNKQPGKSTNGPAMGPGSGHGPGGPGGPGAHLANPKEKARDIQNTLKILWGYLKSQKQQLALVLLVVLVTTALNIAGPYLLKFAIDNYLIGQINLPGLAKVLLAMGVIFPPD